MLDRRAVVSGLAMLLGGCSFPSYAVTPADADSSAAEETTDGAPLDANDDASETSTEDALDDADDVETLLDDADGDASDAASDATSDAPDGECGYPCTCSDGKKDGDETDVDCGGSCGECANGKACKVHADCASKSCQPLFGISRCAAPSCTDKIKNGDETDVDCGGSCPACTLVFTGVTPTGATAAPATLGTIPGVTGKRIRIVKLGICGDSDATSGPNRFVANDGAGLSVSWAAGQTAVAATHTLSPTPKIDATAKRGFSYKVVDHLAATGASVVVRWDYHSDWDALWCGGTDEKGKSYTDAASTVRAWVLYRLE